MRKKSGNISIYYYIIGLKYRNLFMVISSDLVHFIRRNADLKIVISMYIFLITKTIYTVHRSKITRMLLNITKDTDEINAVRYRIIDV